MESHLTSTTAKQRVAIVKNLAYFYLSLSLFYHYYYYYWRKILNESNDTFQVRRHQTRLLLDNARRCTASHPNTLTSWLLKKVRLQLNFMWFKCKFRRFFHNSSSPPPLKQETFYIFTQREKTTGGSANSVGRKVIFHQRMLRNCQP